MSLVIAKTASIAMATAMSTTASIISDLKNKYEVQPPASSSKIAFFMVCNFPSANLFFRLYKVPFTFVRTND